LPKKFLSLAIVRLTIQFGRVSIRREMLDNIQKKITALHTEYITLKFGQGNMLAQQSYFFFLPMTAVN
jgi:hypothetical protein